MHEWVLALLITASTYSDLPSRERGYYTLERTPYTFSSYNACRKHVERRGRKIGGVNILDGDILVCIQTTKKEYR